MKRRSRAYASQLQEADPLGTFLARFGYIYPTEKISPKTIELGLRRYQAFHGLPITGERDKVTMALIGTPRCGVPERQDLIESVYRKMWKDTKASASVAAYRARRGSIAANRSMAEPRLPPVRGVTCKWSNRASFAITYHVAAEVNGLSLAAVTTAIAAACATWSAALDNKVSFQLKDSAADAQVNFQWLKADPDGKMEHAVAHAVECKGEGVQAPVHFDLARSWVINSPSGDQYDIQTIATHEIGHLLGLNHAPPTDPLSIMRDHLPSGIQQTGLTPQDIDNVRSGYKLPLRYPHDPWVMQSPAPPRPAPHARAEPLLPKCDRKT